MGEELNTGMMNLNTTKTKSRESEKVCGNTLFSVATHAASAE